MGSLCLAQARGITQKLRGKQVLKCFAGPGPSVYSLMYGRIAPPSVQLRVPAGTGTPWGHVGLCSCPTDTSERTLNGPASSVPTTGLFGAFFLSCRSRQQEQSFGMSGAGGKKMSETGEILSKIAFGWGRAAQLGLAKMVRYSERILHMLI